METAPMDHSEAVQLMATERYLLGELSPELREAFEEHYFDCQECALDLRAEAAFLDAATEQLPHMATSPARETTPPRTKPARPRSEWFGWLRPAMAIPAFAVLLIVIGYQNIATIPSLRSAASTPRLAPWATLHAGTRAGAHLAVTADHKSGAVLLIDVPNEVAYTSFAFELQDPKGKQFWSQTISAPAESGGATGTLSLLIPGMGLQQGSYTLTISGITSQGSRTQLDRRILDVRFDE
jgi:hypothetical protein